MRLGGLINSIIYDLALVQALYEQLVQEVNGKREEADNKWTRILALWEELKTKERVQLTFTNGETGIIRAVSVADGHFCNAWYFCVTCF
jgi:hypothetical protein